MFLLSNPSAIAGTSTTAISHRECEHNALPQLRRFPLAVIPIFLEQARNDEPITIDGDGTQTRDFVHIDDIVQANLLAVTTDAVGEAYNVGTGTETSVLDLAETIQQATNTNSEIVHTDPQPADINHSVADIAKARERLGYEPRGSLHDGLKSMVKR